MTRTNTDWFRDARWGVFMHFLAHQACDRNEITMTPQSWNRTVEAFDVTGLAEQLASIRAPYFYITIGQNSGFYLSPNQAYDSLVGRRPSRCSERDLVAELAAALEPHDVRLLVYLPSHAPADDIEAVQALKCTPPWDAGGWQLRPGRYLNEADVGPRLVEFQRNWEAVIREWSLRWGRSVHGWWFDGCYYADRLYRSEAEPNFRTFAAAVKAGNPDSIVAFNPGVKVPVISLTEHEDYTAGEIAYDLPVQRTWFGREEGRFVDGAQYHVLSFLGEMWSKGEPRFCDELAVGYTKQVNAREGVITWDVPHTPTGLIPEAFMRQLAGISKAVAQL